jgi:hypothetical protein
MAPHAPVKIIIFLLDDISAGGSLSFSPLLPLEYAEHLVDTALYRNS